MDSKDNTAPELHNRVTKTPGILPKNAQAWAFAAVAVSMILVIAFSSSGTAAKPKAAALVSAQQGPLSQSAIDHYRAQLDDDARRLKEERTRAERSAADARAAGIVPPQPGEQSQVTYPHGERQGPTPEEQQRAALEAARKKREADSLYASNIALTYRKDQAVQSATALPPPLEALSAQLHAISQGKLAGAQPQPVEPSIDKAPAEPKETRKQADSLEMADGKRYRLFEGTILETVLTNRLNGSFTGPVNVMLTADVYSHDHQQLLVPKGSRALGEAQRVSAVGQQRLAVIFHRLIMTDGFSVSLDKFVGMNQIGETGLRDKVNNHYAQLFGVSLALGAIAGMEQIGANYGSNTSGLDAYRLGTSQSLSQSAVRILDRFLNVLPTAVVREGQRVKVYLTGDLELPAFSAHRVPGDV